MITEEDKLKACPMCHTQDAMRLVRTPWNLLAYCCNCVTVIVNPEVRVHFFTVRRRCTACRTAIPEKVLRKQQWLCEHCAYDLTGNQSGVCPECGREISQ